jgi:hypothetical protein
VPRDARKLNVGVFAAALVPTDRTAAMSSVDLRSQPYLGELDYDGIYPDRWLAAQGSVRLRSPANGEAVRIRGTAPGGGSLAFPVTIGVYADGVPLGNAVIRNPGEFDMRLPAPGSLLAGKCDILLELKPVSPCFVNAASGDKRCLTVQLDELGFERGAADETGRVATTLRSSTPHRTEEGNKLP